MEAASLPPTARMTIADVPLLVAAPRRIAKQTPIIVIYHGFGPPDSPQSMVDALPPIPNAITVYPSLPLVGARMPAGGVDELLHRQSEDYIGQLLYPSILGAAHELPQIIGALRKSYDLSNSSPILLFGFSAGGASVLLSLTESDVHPRAVLVINAPLSIVQAVDGYQRQSKKVYVWTEKAKAAVAHFDIEKNADRIVMLNPESAFLLLQSDHDAGFSVSTAQSAATALKQATPRYRSDPDISARALPGADHYALTGPDSASVNAMIRDWLTQHAFPKKSKPNN